MKAMFAFALTRHLVCSPSLCRARGAVVCVAVGHAVFNLNLESLRTHQGRRPDNRWGSALKCPCEIFSALQG